MEWRTDILPTDVESLKQLCLEQAKLLQEKDSTLAQHQQSLTQKQQRIDVLEEFIRYLKHQRYAPSSERHVDQLALFNEDIQLDTEMDIETLDALATSDDAENPMSNHSPDEPRKKPGRRKLPTDLPRVKVFHDLTENEKQCPCGCTLQAFDDVIS